MAHGMQFFGGDGNLTYSSDAVTWNQVDFFFVPATGYYLKDYPVLAGRNVLTMQMFINPPPTDRKAVAHTVQVRGIEVTAIGGSEDAYILVLMR